MPEERAKSGPERGRGRILNKASYQLVYKELRSHLKYWVNRTGKQRKWIGIKPKQAKPPSTLMGYEQTIKVIN